MNMMECHEHKKPSDIAATRRCDRPTVTVLLNLLYAGLGCTYAPPCRQQYAVQGTVVQGQSGRRTTEGRSRYITRYSALP